jgi:hypothetical protein
VYRRVSIYTREYSTTISTSISKGIDTVVTDPVHEATEDPNDLRGSSVE